MNEVFCVQSGDCIECGVGLDSVHATETGALTAALKLIDEKEDPWREQPDLDDWRYIERVEERTEKVLCYWKTKGYDVVIITKEQVQIR